MCVYHFQDRVCIHVYSFQNRVCVSVCVCMCVSFPGRACVHLYVCAHVSVCGEGGVVFPRQIELVSLGLTLGSVGT